MSHSSGPVTHSDSSSTSPPLRLLCSGHTCPHSVNEQHTCSPSLQSSPGITFTSSTLAPPPRQAMLPFATQDFLMLSAWCSSHSLPYGLPVCLSGAEPLCFRPAHTCVQYPDATRCYLRAGTQLQQHCWTQNLQTQLIKVNQVQRIRSLK